MRRRVLLLHFHRLLPHLFSLSAADGRWGRSLKDSTTFAAARMVVVVVE